MLVGWLSQQPASSSTASSPLNFEVFKTKIQPIFLAKRPGHARCISCHSAGTPLRLQPLPAGSATWSDEDSRKNFQAVQRVVLPGVPMKSRLLVMALSHEAGGVEFHPGGKHWESQDDPEWKTLADWVKGSK